MIKAARPEYATVVHPDGTRHQTHCIHWSEAGDIVSTCYGTFGKWPESMNVLPRKPGAEWLYIVDMQTELVFE